jgi:hypothetical protein
MKAHMRWYRRVYWWWKVRWCELDPEKVHTFWDWLNIQDMYLAQYKVVQDPDNPVDHEHVLYPLGREETEAVFQRYLKHLIHREEGKRSREASD